jgi:hypothetical protein
MPVIQHFQRCEIPARDLARYGPSRLQLQHRGSGRYEELDAIVRDGAKTFCVLFYDVIFRERTGGNQEMR